jgi:hypothetical protein
VKSFGGGFSLTFEKRRAFLSGERNRFDAFQVIKKSTLNRLLVNAPLKLWGKLLRKTSSPFIIDSML